VALETANLASVYLQRNQTARAEQLFRQAIACYQQTLPPGHLNIGIAELKLGRTLLREHRYAEAEPYLLAGYQIVGKQTSPSMSWLQTARQDLVTLYGETGHPEKAAQFHP
jgi:tetratricopeptide (TPR) repeat protein